MSRRLAVNVDSLSGRHWLELPEDARVDDLLPSLVEVCEGGSDPAGWSLVPLGEAPLAGERKLGECGLFPGAMLALVAPVQAENAAPGADFLPVSELALRIKATLQSIGPIARLARAPQRIHSIDRMSDAGYLRLLDDAIAAPRSGASTVVAVMSANAGAGTTTVTVMLATLLSSLRSDQVAAVDACPQSGALSHWMAPESGLSEGTYSSLFEGPPTPEQVQAALVNVGRGLAILPAPSDQRTKPAADELAWGRLIQHLRHLHNIVILDCGAGFQRPVSRAALAAADQVVLVSKSTPSDLERLGPTIESIRQRGRTVAVVANLASQRARTKRSAAGVQQVTLAYEPLPAQRIKTRGFAWSDAPYSWQESMRELAAVLVGSALH